MWFKNLQIFKLTEAVPYNPEALWEKLTAKQFKPCRTFLPKSMGWAPPLEAEEGESPLVHGANGFMMLCLQTEEKIVPAGVLRDKVKEKVAEIESQENRRVYNKERNTIKDEIYQQMVSQAFSRISKIHAYIDTQENLLVIDTPSQTKAEEFCTMLRKCADNMQLVIPEVQSPALLMTKWLYQQTAPLNFIIEDACVLEDKGDDGTTVRVKGQDLLSANIKAFLDDGCQVTQLALSWTEQVRFTMKDDFSIRQIKFLEGVKALAKDAFTETNAQRFDADFTIMTESLRHFLKDLMPHLVVVETSDEVEEAVV